MTVYLSLFWLLKKSTVDWVAYKETDIYFSPFWRLEAQDQDTSGLECLVRTRLLAHRSIFSLCPHVVQGVSEFSYDLFASPRSHLLIIIMGVRSQHGNFGEIQTFSLWHCTPGMTDSEPRKTGDKGAEPYSCASLLP